MFSSPFSSFSPRDLTSIFLLGTCVKPLPTLLGSLLPPTDKQKHGHSRPAGRALHVPRLQEGKPNHTFAREGLFLQRTRPSLTLCYANKVKISMGSSACWYLIQPRHGDPVKTNCVKKNTRKVRISSSLPQPERCDLGTAQWALFHLSLRQRKMPCSGYLQVNSDLI